MHGTKKVVFTLAVALVLALTSCGGEEQAQSGASTNEDEGRHLDLSIMTTQAASGPQKLTSVVAEVPSAPVPFSGADGKTHLNYELQTTNFSSGETTIERIEVLDADTGDVISTFDAKEVAGLLQPVDFREPSNTLAPTMTANAFVDLTFGDAGDIPDRLLHRLSVRVEAAPPDQRRITEDVGPTDVDRRAVVVVGPPLKGSNFLAADSCCTSVLHRRAALPVNGRISLAQRFSRSIGSNSTPTTASTAARRRISTAIRSTGRRRSRSPTARWSR